MKTAQRILASLLVAVFFVSTSAPVFATGFDNFQITQDGFNSSNVVAGGRYVTWLTDIGRGGKEVSFTDLLSSTYGLATNDYLDKKDLSIDREGMIVWAAGTGTSTDIYGFSAAGNASFHLTSDNANNQKPRAAGNMITWLKTVSGATHVMVANIFGGMDSGTDLGAGDNPRIVHALDGYIVFFEPDGSGDIDYWESETSTIHTAATPGLLCSNNTLGEAAAGDDKVSYVKTCTLGDQTYYFSTGSDLSSTGDDSNTKVSSSLLTSANTPTMSSSGGDTLVGWVEGSLLSTATIQVKGVLGGLLGLLGLGNGSLLNDKISAAGSNVIWQQHNANGTLDILGHDHSGSGTDYTVATGATLEGVSSISEIPDTGAVWGGFTKTTSGRKDVFVMVPKLTTPVGTDVRVSPGNGSSVTFPTVTQAGDTTFTAKSMWSVPSVPLTGFQLGTIPTYYDVHTTALWSGTATVCFQYKPSNFNDDESLLQILHNESGTWTDRTLSIDTANHIICAGVTSFSELAFVVRQRTVMSTVDVSSVSNVAPTNITITGSGFLSGPKLMLGSAQLTNVNKVDENILTATIPAGIPPGTYDLILLNRYGSGATLSGAVKVTAPGLTYLKDQLAAAGVTLQNAPKVYALVDQAEKLIMSGKNKEGADVLRNFEKELLKVTKSKKETFILNLIPKAYADEVKKVKSADTTDIEKIKGAKKVEIIYKNASLKLPKVTPSPKPVNPLKVKTTEERIQVILTYTDGLINKLETNSANPLALDKPVIQLGALAVAAAAGSIILVHHRKKRRAARAKKG